jgi:hypothetical protein
MVVFLTCELRIDEPDRRGFSIHLISDGWLSGIGVSSTTGLAIKDGTDACTDIMITSPSVGMPKATGYDPFCIS